MIEGDNQRVVLARTDEEARGVTSEREAELSSHPLKVTAFSVQAKRSALARGLADDAAPGW
jgi:hypothetical protein